MSICFTLFRVYNIDKIFTLYLVLLSIEITPYKVYYITIKKNKTKAAGRPEKLNQRHPKNKRKGLFIIAQAKGKENEKIHIRKKKREQNILSV